MTWLLFFIIGCFVIVLQGSVTTIPFLLGWLICVGVSGHITRLFLLAFISGILLDIVTFRMLGSTSLFFILVISLVLLYRRKFEIQSVLFVFLATFISSIGYLWIFGPDNLFFPSFANACFASGLYGLTYTIRSLLFRQKRLV